MLKYSKVKPECSQKGLITYINNLVNPTWLKQEKLLIYMSEDETFQNFNTLEKKLVRSGRDIIQIPRNIMKFRLDFSELPIVLKSVSVNVINKNIQLQPEFTNGYVHLPGYIFGENDPQLRYDISNFDEDLQIELVYEIETEAISIIRSIGSKLDFEIKEKESERLLQEQILLQKNELKKSLINLQFEYNKVISSRRWTIPTKIINFFRRK